jgi:hypothetical protein
VNGGSPRFIIDASVFIEAARRYYGFDIAPTFWQALVQHAQSGIVLSIDRVLEEINNGKDELKEWVNNHLSQAFQTTDDLEVLSAYGRVIEWTMAQTQYKDSAKAEFASLENADAWVVAYAIAKGCTVTTQEQPAINAKVRIPMPNVCKSFGVTFVDTFEMMRRLGIRL